MMIVIAGMYAICVGIVSVRVVLEAIQDNGMAMFLVVINVVSVKLVLCICITELKSHVIVPVQSVNLMSIYHVFVV